MRHNFYPLALLSFCALLAFGSCSKDEITTTQENQITLNGHKLNISIQEEAFEAEKPVSRGTQPTKTDTVDLGNGLYAEVSIEPDTKAPAPAKTRAAMSDGHYTIYAVDASNNRLPDELSGTVSAGQFIPDHNQNIDLTPGTYTFVCFNDAVEDKGNGLDIKNEVENPMIGVTTETISGEHYKISFIMKHWSARVRYEVTTYTAYPANLSAHIWGATFSFGTVHFDQKGVLKSRDIGNISSTTVNINKAGNEAFSPIKKAFLSKSDYSYVSLAVTGGWWKANIDGTVHGKSVHKDVFKNDNLQTNHSYLIKLNLKTKDPLYLYQDGTVGYIGDKTAERQPIAAVIDERTATTDGLAVALNSTSSFSMWNNDKTVQSNSQTFSGYDNMVTDMDGYKYTYEASGSSDNIAKSTVAVNGGKYDAFYQAIHYDPGVALTFSGGKKGKWFLPSFGQVHHLIETFGNPRLIEKDASGGIVWHADYPASALSSLFLSAGGTFFDRNIWLSTECSNDKAMLFGFYDHLPPDRREIISLKFDKTIQVGQVRPFIYF